MENFLAKLIGKKIDVRCEGAASLRGEVMKVEGGVLYLRDSEDKNFYVAIDKIVAIWHALDDDHRAGFVANANKD